MSVSNPQNIQQSELSSTRVFPENVLQDVVSSILQYVGYAKVASGATSPVWRITRVVSSGGNVTSQTWARGVPLNSNIWKTTSDLAITNITQANPGVVTVASTATLGATGATRQITITGVVGMTEVNNAQYTATVVNGTTFSIGVNTTTYTAYGSVGTVNLAEYLNYSYS